MKPVHYCGQIGPAESSFVNKEAFQKHIGSVPYQVKIILDEVRLESFDGQGTLAHTLHKFVKSELFPYLLHVRAVKDVLKESATI
jgi:hypothetical protein